MSLSLNFAPLPAGVPECRFGFDCDHIPAISDITCVQTQLRAQSDWDSITLSAIACSAVTGVVFVLGASSPHSVLEGGR
jgi:hypothetical protein